MSDQPQEKPVEPVAETSMGATSEVSKYDVLWSTIADQMILVLNVVAFSAGVILATDPISPVRPWLAVFLLLFGPGSGLVQLIGEFDTALRWALMIGISLACSVLTAEALIATHHLDSTVGAVILTTITFTGVVAKLSDILIRKDGR